MNFSYFPYDVWHGSTYNIMSAPHFSQSYFYRWCSFGFHINLCKYLNKYDHTISNVPIFWRPTFQVYKVRYWIRDTQFVRLRISPLPAKSNLTVETYLQIYMESKFQIYMEPSCKLTWNVFKQELRFRHPHWANDRRRKCQLVCVRGCTLGGCRGNECCSWKQ